MRAVSRTSKLLGSAAGAVLLCSAGALCAKDDPRYSLIARWRLGGTGGWDYVTADPAARRLYVSRSDRVVVLDLDDGKPVGEIAHTDGVHGIAIAPELGRGFTSNGRANSVTAFDTSTLASLGEIHLDDAQNPDAILYEPKTRRVFTFNGRSANASAIDAKTFTVTGTIGLGGKPEFAVADARGRIFVNIQDRHEIAVIDAAAGKVVATWPIKSCDNPTGLALDDEHHRLFSVCQNNSMIVTDSSDGHEVARLPIGAGPDGAAFDAQRGLVFSSNGEGTLTIVHEDDPRHFRVVDNVATQKSARTLALDPKTHRLFLAAAELGPAPPATPEQPHPRQPMVPDSFAILVVGP